MRDILLRGLEEQGLGTEAVPRLMDFAARLMDKNRVMNLTAITAPEEVARLHLLDCSALLSLQELRGRQVVDVGTGAGFPGMVLRILEPDMDLTLLDSLGKRITWLQEVCGAMALSRITCVHARAEEFAGVHREQFDVAVSRAVAQLNVLCELLLPLVRVGGAALAMKSVDSDAEIDAARGAIDRLGGRIAAIKDYPIPTTEIRHRLVVIEKIHSTPELYPRPFARIKKHPLQ